MSTDQIIKRIDFLLKEANFNTLVFSEFTNNKSKFCFDLLVKKNDLIFTVKVFANIDNLNNDIIKDIKALSILLNAKPILVGIKNRYQNLDDNTIYVRNDLPFVNIKTLETILKHGSYPHILARRGGGITFLDGNKMKTIREHKEISRKEMSEKIGVTKRTICAYENESMHPSQKIALKILDILEDNSLFRKINVFEWNIKFSIDREALLIEDELNPFESHLQDIIKDIGLSSYWIKKGQVPFKLSLYSSSLNLNKENEFYPLFSGVSDEKTKINEMNLKCLYLFAKLFQKKGVFIVNNNFKIPEAIMSNKIPFISIKSLEQIDDEEEFIEFIQDVKK